MKFALMMSTLCIASIGLVGCASKKVEPDQYSGFLKDYSQLKEAQSPSGAVVMRWVDPKLDINKFKSVYIEPTQLYPKPQATVKIPQTTLNGITVTTIRRSNVKSANPCRRPPALARVCMVVRAAITAVSSKTEGLNL